MVGRISVRQVAARLGTSRSEAGHLRLTAIAECLFVPGQGGIEGRFVPIQNKSNFRDACHNQKYGRLL